MFILWKTEKVILILFSFEYYNSNVRSLYLEPVILVIGVNWRLYFIKIHVLESILKSIKLWSFNSFKVMEIKTL